MYDYVDRENWLYPNSKKTLESVTLLTMEDYVSKKVTYRTFAKNIPIYRR